MSSASNRMFYPDKAGSTTTVTPLLTRPRVNRSFQSKTFTDFRRASTHRGLSNAVSMSEGGRTFHAQIAAYNTANSPLVKRLRGRHLQMLAIGGSIGTGLFIGSGQALSEGGPASLLLAFIIIGGVLFCTMQALGELAVTFPVAGSFSAFATRFIDPAWGFAAGWNYAMQWLCTMPLEIMAAALTLDFWDLKVPKAASISVFLWIIIIINLCSVKVYAEAEFIFSIMKVAAVIGFIILGAVINCGGGQDSGYIGGRYWADPGAFHNGFKGFCTIFVIAAFSFSGTELVGLAAAETHNPCKALPKAIKQVFWRISLFYIVAIAIVGLLVPYTSPGLISRSSVDSKASPFIIAIEAAGITGLDSAMNAIVMIAVLSVANSSMYAATRTLQALAEQGQAPSALAYVDRLGRPLCAIAVASLAGCLSYLYLSPSVKGPAFTWLVALSGLSSIFTWSSICFAHIRFRMAWHRAGYSTNDLVYRSPIGVAGSWVGLGLLVSIMAAQLWVAISPIGSSHPSPREKFVNFLEAYLAVPVVIFSYAGYKIFCHAPWIRIQDIDLRTGRNMSEEGMWLTKMREDRTQWPRWKVIYEMLC